jgi:DNA polymerase-3 subunit delta
LEYYSTETFQRPAFGRKRSLRAKTRPRHYLVLVSVMKRLSIISFGRYLATSPRDLLYIFYGEERFFIDQLLTELERYVFKQPADRHMNYFTFYGTENMLSDILSACMSYSMFGTNKLVVVKEFDKLKLDDSESLLKYLHNPQPSTVLVLTAGKWAKTKLHQEIQKLAVTVSCKPLPDSELYGWLHARMKQARIKADQESMSFLVENIGNNLLRLNAEIEKILNYVKPDQKLTLDLVAQLTGFSREVNIFNLQKYLAAKKLDSALKIGLRLLEQGEALAGILPMIYLFFRKTWVVIRLREQSLTNAQILQKLSGTAFAYQDVFVAEKKFTLERIGLIMEKILEAEIQLKTTQQAHDSILTMLCYYICQD